MYAALYCNCLMKIPKVQLKHCRQSFLPFVQKSINSQQCSNVAIPNCQPFNNETTRYYVAHEIDVTGNEKQRINGY